VSIMRLSELSTCNGPCPLHVVKRPLHTAMPAEESCCSAVADLGLSFDTICIACHRFCILVCGTLIYGRGDEVEEKEIVAEMAAEAGQPIGACCCLLLQPLHGAFFSKLLQMCG
jgi:hypothetical protein